MLNVFGFAMAFFYLVLGIYILVEESILNFSQIQQAGIGIILICYGLFRLYRTYSKLRKDTAEKE